MKKTSTFKRFALLVVALVSSIGNAFGFEYNGLTYRIVDNNAKTVKVSYQDSPYTQTSIVIPPTVPFNGDDYKVVEIGDNAFSGASLSSIQLPSTIENIGSFAFQDCSNLTSIDLKNVTAIGSHAFYNCFSLTSVTLPNVTRVGRYAFRDCSNLSSIDLSNISSFVGEQVSDGGDGIISYPAEGVFAGCTSLTSVQLPSNLQSILPSMFSGCTNLASFTFSSNIRTIDNGAFSGCTGLTAISFLGNNISIGNGAFSGCTGLTTLTLPKSIYSIEDNAFSGCTGLTSITVESATIGDYAFQNCTNLTNVEILSNCHWMEHNGTSENAAGGIGVFDGCNKIQTIICLDMSTGYWMRNGEGNESNSSAAAWFTDDVKEQANVYVPGSKISAWNSSFLNVYAADISSVGGHVVEVPTGNYEEEYDELGFYPYTVVTGTISINGKEVDPYYGQAFIVTPGSDVTVKVTPNTEYYVSSFTVNGSDERASLVNGVYPINKISGNQLIKATFGYGKRTIEGSYDEMCGGVFFNGSSASMYQPGWFKDEFDLNSNVRMTINTYDGYSIKSIKVDGTTDITTEYKTDGYYDFANLTDNHTVNIEFETAQTYTIHVVNNNCADGGSTTDNYGHGDCEYWAAVAENDSYVLTITPFSGMKVSSFMVDNEEKKDDLVKSGDDWTYTISSVTNNMEISVSFERSWTLTVTYNNNGSVTCDGTVVASGTAYESNQDYINVDIQPQTGSEIASIVYNGTEQLGSPYGGSYPMSFYYGEGSNQTLVVTFRLEQCYVNVNMSGAGTMTMNNESVANGDQKNYDPNTDVTLTFAPAAGWQVASADINGTTDITSQAQSGSYTIPTIDGNKTVNVTFVPVSLTFAAPYMTICSPQAIDLSSNTDVTAWAVVGFESNRIKLVKMDVVPAGMGALLQAAEGTTFTPTFTSRNPYNANLLVGTLAAMTINEYGYNSLGQYCRNYIFAKSNDGTNYGFFPVGSEGTLAAGKAYLPIPTEYITNSNARFVLDFSNETGIDEVEQNQEEQTVYSLSGVRMDNAQKRGIYIVNGKKVVVK